MKLIPDIEINLTEDNDHLRTIGYVKCISKVIDNIPENIDSSFAIGLFGEWGSGKSSIIKTLEIETQANTEKKYGFVKYDAWKYVKDSFRRMFLLKVQESLGYEPTNLLKSFYSEKNEEIDLKKIFDPTVFIVVSFLFISSVICLVNTDFAPELKITIPVILTLLTIIFSIIKDSTHILKINHTEKSIFAAEQFEDCFNEMVNNSFAKTVNRNYKWVKNNNHTKDLSKIIIVVDNIDRCHEESSYELLTNIKTFLANSKNIIFIIPVDENALKRHISKSTDNYSEIEEGEAAEFLRKFFNVTIRLKPYKPYDMFSFAKKLNDTYELGFNPLTLDLIGREYATNPRRIIQFCNNFISFMSDFDEKFINEYETVICKLLLIKEEWPTYYDMLCYNPYILHSPTPSSEKYLSKNDNKALRDFLRTTLNTTSDINIATLGKIMLNEDDFTLLPNELLKYIHSIDYEMISSYIDDNLDQLDLVFEYIIEKMKSYITNQRNDSLIQYFTLIILIDEKYRFNEHKNTIIENTFSEHYSKFIHRIKQNQTSLVQYANRIEIDFGLKKLKSFLLNFVSSSYGDMINPDEIISEARSLLPVMTKYFRDEFSLKSIQKAFELDFQQFDRNLEDYSLDSISTPILVTQTTIDIIIRSMEDNKFFALETLAFVSEKTKLRSGTINKICEKINSIYPDFDNVIAKDVIDLISSLNAIFRNINKRTVERKEAPEIHTLFSKIISPRQIQSVQHYLLDEIKNNIKFTQIVCDFLYCIYKVSGNTVSTVNELSYIKNSILGEKIVLKTIYKLKDIDNFSVFPLFDIIISYNREDKDYIKLLFDALIYKDGDYKIEDSDAKSKMINVLSVAFDKRRKDDHFILIEPYLKDERIIRLSVDIISSYFVNKFDIIPKTIIKELLDYISDNKLLTLQYIGNFQFIKSYAKHSHKRHVPHLIETIDSLINDHEIKKATDLVNLINRNLSNDEKRALQDILNKPKTNRRQKNYIRTALKHLKNL